MRTIKTITAALIAVTCLTTCTKSGKDDDDSSKTVNIIATVSGMEMQTKAALNETRAGAFNNGDVIRLTWSNGASGHTTNFAIGTTKIYWEDLITAHGTPPFGFSAFYPAISDAIHTDGFNVVTADNPALLYAAVAGANKGVDIHLEFRHLMHKIEVNLMQGDTYFTAAQLNSARVTLKNMKSTAAVSANGTADLNSASGNDDYPAQTGRNTAFIVAPQILNTEVDLFEIEIGDQTLTYQVLAETARLESGKVSTFNFIIGKQGIETIAVTGVTLNKNATTLTAHASETLIAAVAPANATNQNVTWSSSNNAVATVNSNGVVVAVAEGTAEITVTTSDGGYIATCDVVVATVLPPFTPVEEITGVPTATMAGTPLTLSGTVTPANATNQTITWSLVNAGTTGAAISGNTLNANVSGTVTVRATIIDGVDTGENYVQNFTITVTEHFVSVTGVTLNKNSATLTVGENETLIAGVIPANATNQNLTWSSNNSSVAIVDSNGRITAVSAGTATITVRTADGNHAFTCTVTVNPITDAEPPSITSHPQSDATYNHNATATALSVAASVGDGGTLSYQWFSNTTNSTSGGTLISGATGTTYTPLTSAVGTLYYYVVVTNTNNSVNGARVVTAASSVTTVTVNALTYIISASPTNPSFGTLAAGYTSPLARMITITNTGTGAVTLNPLPAVTNYTLSALSRTNVPAGETATFTIHPDEGLAVGTYNRQFNVTGSNGTSVAISPTFTVQQFVAVTNINNVTLSVSGSSNYDLTLEVNTSTAIQALVHPSNATNRDIVWSVVDAELTGMGINGTMIYATNPGSATIRATVVNGRTATANYTQDFTIQVR
jgi:uncharacterized protein YjdB